MNIDMLNYDDIDTDNPTTRVPVCLVLDTSGSMTGEPIIQLNSGLKELYKYMYNDEECRYAAEIAIVTFGHGGVKVITNFNTIDYQSWEKLYAFGRTPMGEAVNTALDLLENRKKLYKENGITYYQPWMILITDGEPTDDISIACKRTRELIKNEKLCMYPIGVGSNVDYSRLKEFGVNEKYKLKGVDYSSLFKWLGMSISQTSVSKGKTSILDMEAGEWKDVIE